ncbi:MAG TPA: ricin-type beta-trefoil lectin domain protein [Actinophytocola sp.]|uniref:ricin-type beta-trefoil lectin domain protein n=1 Tax=Actinophytocola sp. TaxID=1872138 RepID=UPI002DC01644|nr:ricin-type beta-trefoil lectin domain protein [Actinophytocola sp.]HEU5470811.1 ricin-type beta-trefoil lectin domain protein [Actinophytocola sp.]
MGRRRVGVVVGVVGVLVVGGVVGVPGAGAVTNVTINGGGAGRVFDGVGAVSGGGGNSRLLIDYPEPQRGQILDYLFRPNFGAAMQLLKVEIGGDTYSTSGAEPSHQHSAADLNCDRGYEWWLMGEAKARNPGIRLAGLSWGAPGWIGNGNFWSTDMINYLVAWLRCARDVHGLTIDYLGGWNERGRDLNWYVNLNNALDANGFGNVRIVASDDSSGWSVADDAVGNAAFRNAVDVLGVHYVCGYRSAQTNCPSSANAVGTGKTLWASENGSDDYNAGAAALARGINRGYVDGRMTAYINWPVIAAVYPNLPFPTMGVALAPQPWSGHYSVGRNAWVMAHTSQFTAPGWRYLDQASGFLSNNRNIGSYVTLRSSTGNQWSTVVETTGATAPEQFTFTVTGGLAGGAVRVWSTNLNSSNPNEYLVRGPDLAPSGSTYTINLQPGRLYTLTTTTGGGKGTASGPAQASFALPYNDNYDGYALGREARYLADLQGSFEVSNCAAGRTGRCVRQMAPRAPITWAPLSDAYTLLGDVNWATYTVSTDVLLESAGFVELLGRVGTQTAFNPPGLNAYRLRVSNTGAWSIRRTNTSAQVTTLASGTVAALGTNTWHTIALAFNGNTISARIDGSTVGTVTDGTFPFGQVGFASGWNYHAQFDNLAITGQTPPPNIAGPLRNVAANRCLDVSGGSQANGAQVIIWDCNGNSNQRWTQTAAADLRVFDSKCLDVLNQAVTPGSPVSIWDCNGGDNQKWTSTSGGALVGRQSNLCLAPSGAGSAAGTPLVIASCTGAASQQWSRS